MMKHTPEWRVINIEGFSRYEVSEDQRVRVAATKRLIAPEKRDKGGDVVRLYVFGKQKYMRVGLIMMETFNTEFVECTIPEILILKESEQYSANEDEYGKGANKKYWRELKDQIQRIKDATLGGVI